MMRAAASIAAMRRLESADREIWEALWRENLMHFKAGEVAIRAIPTIWERLIASHEAVLGWLLTLEDRPAGLVHVVLRQHTFSTATVGILEDLWIAPWARGRGLAHWTIDRLVAEARGFGWRRLEWETDDDNAAARGVYERLAQRMAVQRYQIDLVQADTGQNSIR